MSTHIASDVWKYSQAHGAALLVLVSLADQANDAGECWPSVESIAARCRVSVRSVHRYLVELTVLGELEKRERPGRSSAYIVRPLGGASTPAKMADPQNGPTTPANLAHPPAKVTQAPANLTHPTPANVADGSATAGRQNHHLTGRTTTSSTTAGAADETTTSPDPTKHTAARPRRDDVERLCTHLADRIAGHGLPRPRITDRWRDQGRLLLDSGPTEAQVRAVIDWCQDDEFWAPNVMSMGKLKARFGELQLRSRNQRASTSRKQTDDAEAEAKRVRARRLAQAHEPIPPAHLTGAQAAAWLRDARRRIADGLPVDELCSKGFSEVVSA